MQSIPTPIKVQPELPLHMRDALALADIARLWGEERKEDPRATFKLLTRWLFLGEFEHKGMNGLHCFPFSDKPQTEDDFEWRDRWSDEAMERLNKTTGELREVSYDQQFRRIDIEDIVNFFLPNDLWIPDIMSEFPLDSVEPSIVRKRVRKRRQKYATREHSHKNRILGKASIAKRSRGIYKQWARRKFRICRATELLYDG